MIIIKKKHTQKKEGAFQYLNKTRQDMAYTQVALYHVSEWHN